MYDRYTGEIVRSIKYVDAVVPQYDMDKLAACKKLGATVLFVGDDWYGTEKWNKYEKEHLMRYNRVMHPFRSNLLRFLEKMHILTVSKSYYLYLCAVIQCESHRSSLLFFLRNKLK